MVQRVFVLVILSAAFIACSDSDIEDNDSDDSEGPSCRSFAPRNCPTGSCVTCLRESCCAEVAACMDNTTCTRCFSTGNFSSCAGLDSSNDLVICSANECSVCNGCY